jgi:alkanesulfonate monooxygenase SsuD/methylene tetrahydromethanopterin reductase-like flavin-dependent oxidoreductase (luciferase family)
VPTLAEAEAHPWTEGERAFAADRNVQQAGGTREQVRARVSALVDATGANEVIVVPQGPDLESRVRTLSDLAA